MISDEEKREISYFKHDAYNYLRKWLGRVKKAQTMGNIGNRRLQSSMDDFVSRRNTWVNLPVLQVGENLG